VDSNELRRLAAAADEEHRATMHRLRDLLGSPPVSDDGEAGRRTFLRRLGLGGALAAAAVPAFAEAASAQTATTSASATSTTTGAPATGTTVAQAAGTTTIASASSPTTGAPAGGTTVAPPAATTTSIVAPAQPTPDDLVVFAFAQSLELALAQLYDAAAKSGKLGAEIAPIVVEFGGHHRQHAQAFAGMAGKAATGTANQTLLSKTTPMLEGAADEKAMLTVLLGLENAAAASYTQALGSIVGTNGAASVASIQPIEARHATVFAQAIGQPVNQYVIPLQTTAGAVTAANYPIIER
jgi:hypothetical protein